MTEDRELVALLKAGYADALEQLNMTTMAVSWWRCKRTE